ncbi:MAG: Hsp70 family protein [Acidobacteriota bacterium]
MKATDLDTNNSAQAVFTACAGLRRSMVQQLLSEAEEYKEEDGKRRVLAELKNSADWLLYRARRAMKDRKQFLSSDVLHRS